MSNSSIAFIGDRNSIIGFKLIGSDVFPAKDSQEFLEIFQKINKKKYSAIFVTEDVVQEIVEKVEALQKEMKTSLTIIPKRFQNIGVGEAVLKRNIKKAIGTDIM
jgi:V/A-type H+/Na+-transporting ATPase subunit F